MEVEQPLSLQTLVTSDEERDLLKSPDCHEMTTSGAPSPTNIEIAIDPTSNSSYKFDESRTTNGEVRSAIACNVRDLSDCLTESVPKVILNSTVVNTEDNSPEVTNSTTHCGDIGDLKKPDSDETLVVINNGENCDGISVSEVSPATEIGSPDLVVGSVPEIMDVDETGVNDNIAISETLTLPVDDELLENEVINDDTTECLQTGDGATTEEETQDILPSEESSLRVDDDEIEMPHNTVDQKPTTAQLMDVNDESIPENRTPDDTQSKLVQVLSPTNTPSLAISNGEILETETDEGQVLATSRVSDLEEDEQKNIDVDMEDSLDNELVLQVEEEPSIEANITTVDGKSESVPGESNVSTELAVDNKNGLSDNMDGISDDENGLSDDKNGLSDNKDRFDKHHDGSVVTVDTADDISSNCDEEQTSDKNPNLPTLCGEGNTVNTLNDQNRLTGEKHESNEHLDQLPLEDEYQPIEEDLIASDEPGTPKACDPKELAGVDIEIDPTAAVLDEEPLSDDRVLSAPADKDSTDDTSGNQDDDSEEKAESDEHLDQPVQNESHSPENESPIAILPGESETLKTCVAQEHPVEDPAEKLTAVVVEGSGTLETTKDPITDCEARQGEPMDVLDGPAVTTALEVDNGTNMNDEVLDEEIGTSGVTNDERISAAYTSGDITGTIGKKRRASAPSHETHRAAKIAKGRSSLADLDEATESEGFAQTLESLKNGTLPVLASGQGESIDPLPKSPDSTPGPVDLMVIDLDDDDPVETDEPISKTTIPEPMVNGHDNESPDPPPPPAPPVKDGVYSFIDRLFGDQEEITIKKKLFKKIIQTCFAERIQALTKTKAPPMQQAILAAQKCNQLQKSVFNFEGQREDTKVLLNKLIEDRRAKKTWDESLVPPRATRSVGLQVCINGKLFLKQTGNSTSSQMFSTELTTKDLSNEMQRKAGAQQRQTLSQRERIPVRKVVVSNARKSTTSAHISPTTTRLTNGTVAQPAMVVTTAGPGSQMYALSPTKSTFSVVKPVPDNIVSRVVGSPNTNFRQSPAKGASPGKQYQLTAAPVVANAAKPVPVNIVRTVVPNFKTAPVRPGPSLKTPNTSQQMTLVSTPTQTPKPQPSASATIDLTDDDAASARPVPRAPTHTPVTSPGSARKSTSMRNSSVQTLQNGTSPQRSKAFPSLPPNPPNFNPATAPPRPHLGICNTKTITQGIMLTWHFNGVTPTRKVTKFQVFAYQESKDVNQGLSDDAWKKVGDVNALPLPMACTLTQFREGFTYHFIVRAVDEIGEVGLFSTPNTITLMRKT